MNHSELQKPRELSQFNASWQFSVHGRYNGADATQFEQLVDVSHESMPPPIFERLIPSCPHAQNYKSTSSIIFGMVCEPTLGRIEVLFWTQSLAVAGGDYYASLCCWS